MLASGFTEFDVNTFYLSLIMGAWQINTFYDNTSFGDTNLDFNQEELISSLINKKNYNYNDLIGLYFCLIFSANFVGLVPYTQTITSQLAVTLFLSMTIMLTVWLHAFYDNKISMLNHFLPSGSPIIITPFIIVIEIISNLSRIVSLSVRLFANMTSGHALLKILASFGVGALSLTAAWGFLFIFPVGIIFIVSILELIIAFLQTYVFVTLSLIYVSEQE